MRYIKYRGELNENWHGLPKKEYVDLVFIPSGEIINITLEEYEILVDYFVIDYDYDLECFSLEDNFKERISMILNYDFDK